MISCQSLSKTFRVYKKNPGWSGLFKTFFNRQWVDKQAVKDFTLNIEQGEFVGFLGPNGAGKTTLIKMFTGLIEPTSGSLEVLGFTPYSRQSAFRQKLSLVMGQKFQMFWDLPAIDSLLLFQRYYQIPHDLFKKRLDYFCDILNIGDLLNINIRKLSLGERMKFELVSCLLHKPEIIFLDEPTLGLDLIAQKNVRNFLQDYHSEHKPTIILTSHYMADIDALCPRIVLIMNGEKFFDGSVNKFVNILGPGKLVTFFFKKPITEFNSDFLKFNPEWSEDRKQATLLIPFQDLPTVFNDILQRFPVGDFHTEKLPIERVTHMLFNNPKLLK